MNAKEELRASEVAVCSWSGGKDSCFALYLALYQGIRIRHIINTISKEFRRVRFHGVKAELIQAQADAIGINLVQIEIPSNGNYEKEFKQALQEFVQEGIGSVVCGDIALEDSRVWMGKVCGEIGLSVVDPLWGRRSEEVLKEFINHGFEATVVSANVSIFDKSWVGRKVDAEFLGDIKRIKGIDVCGENGEFHTFVTGGPIFRKKIIIGDTGVVRKDTHWMLDIREYAA